MHIFCLTYSIGRGQYYAYTRTDDKPTPMGGGPPPQKEMSMMHWRKYNAAHSSTVRSHHCEAEHHVQTKVTTPILHAIYISIICGVFST